MGASPGSWGREQGVGLSRLLVAALLAATLAAGALIATAGAAEPAPAKLFDFCPSGAGAGQCSNARGIVANPENGHLYVAELSNHRVNEFNAGGEFVRAWGFGVADGTSSEFQICTATCFKGKTGTDAGAFRNPTAVAMDDAGNLYVTDLNNHRIQKFGPKGEFLLMFGGEVNKTTGADVCTKADLEGGDECGAGTIGGAPGEFNSWDPGWFPVANIAIQSDGTVLAGDRDRIEEFDSGGNYLGEIALAGEGSIVQVAVDSNDMIYYRSQGKSTLVGKVGGPALDIEGTPTAIAVDPDDDLWVFDTDELGSEPNLDGNPVRKFDPESGEELTRFGKGEFTASTGMATNLCPGSEAPGNVYVVNSTPSSSFIQARGTDPIGCFKATTLPATEVTETSATLNGTVNPDGSLSAECRFEWGTDTSYGNEAPCLESPAEIGEGTEPVPVHADLSGLEPGTVHHFRLVAKVGAETETGSDEEFKTTGPPTIADEHLLSAGTTGARIKGLVNPEGFPTTYSCEYGPTAAYGQSTPAIPIGSEREDKPVLCTLTGLDPDTTYHWRLIASNTSDASVSSGPTESADHTLKTYRAAVPQPPCPNDALRFEAAALLPDCRAYEMVSPVDKNGGDIYSLADEYVQAAPDGDALTYTTLPSFAGQPNAFTQNQYLASRGGGGWSNEGLHTPVAGGPAGIFAMGLVREFMAFTPDLCDAWLLDPQTPPPTIDGQPEDRNLYRRDNCEPGLGGFEPLVDSSIALPDNTGVDYVSNFSMGGVSADGRHAAFTAEAKLNADASSALGSTASISSMRAALAVTLVNSNS